MDYVWILALSFTNSWKQAKEFKTLSISFLMYIRTIMQPYIIQKEYKNISTSIFKVGKHYTYVSDYHLACYRTECGWRIVFSLVFDLTGLFVLHTSKPVTVLLYINYILNVNFLNFWPLRWCFHARGQKARRSKTTSLPLNMQLLKWGCHSE